MNRFFGRISVRYASGMRFCQFHDQTNGLRLGAQLSDGSVADISAQYPDLKSLISAGAEGISKVSASLPSSGVAIDSLKMAPAIHNPEKIICIGLNYSDHCTEQNLTPPNEPVVFNKFPSTLVGHGDAIQLPKIGCNTDLEAELAIIIGKEGRHISKESAFEHVFGYTIANDVSGRDWQKKRNGGQWLLGKTFDTFCPLGPVVATDVDPSNLKISSWIGDDKMQDSSTKFLIFDIPFIINWVSQICTLKAGDVILTGTPGGVGMHRNPPKFLADGDNCVIEIEGLGRLSNPVKMEE